MLRNLGHEGNPLKGGRNAGSMAELGCTQQTLHFLCDGLEYSLEHLKGNSIPDINLCAHVGSLLVVEKFARMAMTDSQRPGSVTGMSLCMDIRGDEQLNQCLPA